MRILRNYVLKEIAGPLLTSLGVFTFILLIGNMFKLADLLVNKGVDIKLGNLRKVCNELTDPL